MAREEMQFNVESGYLTKSPSSVKVGVIFAFSGILQSFQFECGLELIAQKTLLPWHLSIQNVS
jgi:hypothetical protein